jgi:tetratricopeptide (TPR) repeat protein
VTTERWDKVAEVLGEALSLPPEARGAYLDDACAGDPELRREVDSLVTRDERHGDLLDAPESLLSVLATGARIGPYQLGRLIGAGGMGAVYVGTRVDDQYHSEVAIKFLPPGVRSPELTRRFRAERQILASLQHPNIARLFDGGLTDDGQPYFVMEYVEGAPIDRFCEGTGATIAQRIEVFRRVCDAVQTAHRALIVHRDIKPANILVQPDGRPKLLDFGIAKMLTAEPDGPAERTVTHLRAMTPEYASPEQIRGEPVTTATDIYSLGVVLYKLLVGSLPHRSATGSVVEIERSICEIDPKSPDRVTSGRVDRDLSAVVMKALRKEPAERYGSVEQFDGDLQRYQQGYPVLARRGSRTYRAGKFLRRNRTATSAAALIVLSLAGGAAVSSWQAAVARAERRKADEQRQMAERRFAEVRRLANSFLFEFDRSIADLAGATAARQLVVSTALEYLSTLAKDARGDTQLLTELASAYQRVGDIQGHPFFANLGDRAGALRSYGEALRIWNAVTPAVANPADAHVETAFLRRVIGDVLAEDKRAAAALVEYEAAFQLLERAGSAMSPTYEAPVRTERIGLIGRIGSQLAGLGKVDEGVRWCQRAVVEGRASMRRGHVEEQHELSVLYARAGKALLQAGALETAAALHQEEIAVSEMLATQAAPEKNAHFRRDVALAYRNLAEVFFARKDFASALAWNERAREIQKQLLAADAASSQMRKELATTHTRIAAALVRQQKRAEAEHALATALRLSERVLQDDPTSKAYRMTYAERLRQMGELLAQSGRPADARRYYQRESAVLERIGK